MVFIEAANNNGLGRNISTMIKAKLISAVVTVAAMVSIASPAAAHAIVGNTNNDQCAVNPKVAVTLQSYGKNFTVSEDKTQVSTTFVVSGTDANCKKDVTFVSWTMPKSFDEAGYQLKEQKVYSKTTIKNATRGEHTLTINLPTCAYWQLDVLEGTQATSDNGDADYGFGKAHMLDTLLGGSKDDKACTPVNPPVTPPVTPETPVTPPVTSVPSTGAGSIVAGTAGLSTSVGLAYNLIRRKKLML